jgi:hypothetical protein
MAHAAFARFSLAAVLTGAGLVVACGDASSGGPDADMRPDAGRPDAGGDSDAGEPVSAMPLLPDGTHLSLNRTFELLPQPTADVAGRLWSDALDAGMRTARIQLDWASVESAPGEYDKDALRSELERLQEDGLVPFVGIYAVDSGGLVLPEDLMDTGTATGIRDGMSLDDPSIRSRFREMLNWAVPMIVEHGGYVLSIANEPAAYMEEHPDETDSVIRFYEEAVAHAHSIDPELAMTVTLTSTAALQDKFFHEDVLNLVDVATYNYYCLKLTDRFVLRAPLSETVTRDLDTLVDASAGKEVIFQELGCPAGWTDRESVIGTSEQTQKEFFERALPAIRARGKIRAAYVFQMVDWSEELTQTIVDDFVGEDVSQAFVDSFKEWLETIGFVTYEQGRIRPSWDVFLQSVDSN